MDQLLNVEQAARRTGMSASWVRQRIFRREIRFLKIGSRVLIPESTIEELIQSSIVEPRNQYKQSLD